MQENGSSKEDDNEKGGNVEGGIRAKGKHGNSCGGGTVILVETVVKGPIKLGQVRVVPPLPSHLRL